MTIRALLGEGRRRLEHAGMETARQEVAWLLGRLLHVRLPDLYLYEGPISPSVTQRFRMTLEARVAGAPLQYLLGEADFFGATFAVAPGVFIPRPETEAVLEAALRVLRERALRCGHALRLLDLGTGSGCIAITLARQLPSCLVVGVEVSCHAVRIAQTNVRRYRLQDRVQLVQGRWTKALRGTFDGIISNPPYIPNGEVDDLPREVRHEPRLSLDGGRGGLRDLEALCTETPRHLPPDGLLVMECGEEQVPVLVQRLGQSAWAQRVSPISDMAGRARGVLATRR